MKPSPDPVRLPGVVWGLLGLHGLLLLTWALVVPAYRAPDEPQHLDMVFALRADGRWPDAGERRVTQQVRRSQHHFPLRGFDDTLPDAWPLPAQAALPRAERPSFAEVAPDAPSDAGNQQWQHPPLYYATVAAVLGTVPGVETMAFDRVLLVARLTSAVMVLPLPVLAWSAARTLDAGDGVATTAAVLTLAVPQLTHVGASVNNDNLLVLFASAATVAGAAVARGDVGRRTAVTFGAISAGGLLAKGFGVYLPAFVVAAYALLWSRSRTSEALRRGALAVAVCLVLGGWWYVRNLVRYGTVQPSGARFAALPTGFEPDVLGWLTQLGPRVVERFWGVFGLLQAPLPGWVVVFATLALAASVTAGLAARRGIARADASLLLLPLAATAAITAYGSWRYHAESGGFPGMQGRYLFPGIVGLAVVAGAGLVRLARRWVPAGAAAAAVALQVLGLHTTARYFWGDPDRGSLVAAVRGALAWSPLPAPVTAVVGLAALVAGVAIVAVLVRDAARRTATASEVGS